MANEPVEPSPKAAPSADDATSPVSSNADVAVPAAPPSPPAFPHRFPRLAATLGAVVRGSYDELATYILSVASTWSYADPQTFAEAMSSLGWENRAGPAFEGGIATKTVRNDALLVKTTASFLQSGKVGILCFRGTEPTNVLQWLSDATAVMEPFSTWGQVHSGFYRSLTPVLPFIHAALAAAAKGHLAPSRTSLLADGAGIQMNRPIEISALVGLDDMKDGPGVEPMEALYLTGHSLGGALAVLAAAVIFEDARYALVREKLRGVYTFGQPLIGDENFCNTAGDRFGELVFRHVYEHDVVPHLPSKDFSPFYTLGTERVATPEGWSAPAREAKQARFQAAVAVGVVAWYAQQTSLLHKVELPYSIADHMPNNYMASSRIPFPDPG